MPKCVISKTARLDCSQRQRITECLDKYQEQCEDVTATLADEGNPLEITRSNCDGESQGICTVDVKRACDVWGCYHTAKGEHPALITDANGAPLLQAVKMKYERSRHPSSFQQKCKKFAREVADLPPNEAVARCFDWIFVG